MQVFQASRASRKYTQTIQAPPNEVFPLLCPVREAEWLEGWDYKMIYSDSGLVEEGAVFSTSMEGEANTIWIVTRHESKRHIVEFARVTPFSRASILTIKVRPKDTDQSYVDITYTYTSLSEAGNTFIDGFTENTFMDAVLFWEKSMNHYLKTGKKMIK